ncbi:hypothetical protein GN956_G22500 [Arapaima gigas]
MVSGETGQKELTSLFWCLVFCVKCYPDAEPLQPVEIPQPSAEGFVSDSPRAEIAGRSRAAPGPLGPTTPADPPEEFICEMEGKISVPPW